MKMLRRFTRGHDRINSGFGQFTKAQMTEEGVSGSDVEE